MKRILYILFAVFTAFCISCKPEPQPNPNPTPNPDKPVIEIVKPDADSGITFDLEELDADKPCTIFFNPTASSAVSKDLYNYTGDIYVHIGVIYDEDWTLVQADWGKNIDKCKMERLGDNSYKLALEPTIREYFAAGTTPVERIGMVMRSADGKKQTKPDQFMYVVDRQYHSAVFEPDPVVKETMPSGVKPGINYNSDNSVTLVLYDKSTASTSHDWAYVIGDFNAWKREKDYAMKRDDAAGCWWTTLTKLDPDREYRFQYYIGSASESFRLFDATSELIYDPWNDKYISSKTYPNLPAYPQGTKERVGVFQINKPVYAWQVPEFAIKDENNLVIYELLFRDFTTTHDIPGALTKLDYLQTLGVTAIELMPIQEFEGNESWGYNPCAYFALDKAYGTRQMYKQFIDECHKRGIAVIVDVVYNHTTGAHPFARLWWDADNNNVSSLNPHYNVITPHGFGVFQDINHKNGFIVDHIKRSLTYLLTEYKVDGFRFDLTKGFTNNSGKDSSYDQDRVDILKGYAAYVKSVKPNAMVIFEHFVDVENGALGEGGAHIWGKCTEQYIKVVKGVNTDLSAMYDPSCVRVGYMESHDEERICYGDVSVGGDVGGSTVSWGVVGTINDWSAPDITMVQEGTAYVAKNVTFTDEDAFKIRGNETWNDKYNYGCAVKYTKLPLNTGYTLTVGSSSQDMKAPAAGTYDIYFSPDVSKIWMMTPGQRPEDIPTVVEDAFTLKMRRAGLAAAYTLLVPGPKMIWQFGELGYDYSIEYNGRTSAKPIKWEYYDVPARKMLYDTYCSLLAFRNANPEFFTKGANFTWYVGTGDYASGKFMFCEAGGKKFGVMGNFDTVGKDITMLLGKEGPWYDYATGEELTTSNVYTTYLKSGEFRVLVDFK